MFRRACSFAWLAVVATAEPPEACPSEDHIMIQRKQSEGLAVDGIAKEVAAGLELSDKFLAVARHPNVVNPVTKSLMAMFGVCGRCDFFRRLGEKNDGGYLTCMDNVTGLTNVLSAGVSYFDQWSRDMFTVLGQVAPVAQFDCTVKVGQGCGPQCQFFPKCLAAEDGHNNNFPNTSVTLSEAIAMARRLNNESFDRATADWPPNRSLILKMDIEGAEWPIYAVEDVTTLHKFRQIIVEFHGLHEEAKHPEMLAAMKNLKAAGFSVAHLHGNNFDSWIYRPVNGLVGLSIPDVFEVTMIADAPQLDRCIYSQDRQDGLDAPNNANAPETPPVVLKLEGEMAHYPYS